MSGDAITQQAIQTAAEAIQTGVEALAALISAGRLKTDIEGMTLNADVVDLDVEAITGTGAAAKTLADLVSAIEALSGGSVVSIATAPVEVTAGNNKDLLEGVSAPGAGKAIWLLGVACTATVDGTIKYHDAGGTKRSGTMSIMAKGGHAIGYSGNAIMPAIMFGTNVKPQVDLVTCNIGGVGLYAIVSV